MASAGPGHVNLGHKQQKSVGLESGTLLAERSQPFWAWRLAQQQAKPVWNLDKRYVSAFQNHILLPSGIPLQQSCFLCSPSLCHAQPTEDTLRSPRGIGSVRGRVMSSLLMEPCLLAENSGQQAACSYSSVLNNSSFLQPSSAKVPFLQSLKIKKVENTQSFPTASWSHSRNNEDSFPSSLISRAVTNSSLVSQQTAVPSFTPVPSSVILRKDQCSWEDAKGRLHSSKEEEPEKGLLKAVQLLPSQAATRKGFGAPADKSQLELSHPEDDAEEELPDGLDESCGQEEYEDSECRFPREGSAYCFIFPRNCVKYLTQPAEAEEKVLKPALVCSLFPNVPPTIYFSTLDETVEKLPWEQRKLLRWKMSRVTPNIVKQTIGRSHFRVSKSNNDWLGCWGPHMRSPGFKSIREHQKLNHFPGSFQIGRKDRLWRNLLKMQARCGKKEFNFFPQSFILPQDIKLLRKAWEEGASRQKWIVKPPASARGVGIQVIHKWSQLPKRRPLLVQRYLHRPYLIGGKKFDLRIYVYVTCYDPLRVYLFKDGLVRFASCKYSYSMDNLSNKFIHLTNYSVNKKNAAYKSNSDEIACQGHKWALKALWSYLTKKGVNSEAIWEKIKDIVIKTIIASEPYVNNLVKLYVRRPYCCHELFGFDIMLDENLKPWILEVNISPSLHSNSPLDVSIKGQMVRDVLNLAGFVLPSVDSMVSGTQTRSGSTCSLGSALREKSKLVSEYFKAEKMKKAYYSMQKIPDQDFYSSVLDTLTPDDVRILVETEDEYSRRGQFERVFPNHFSMRYLRFFEQPRYFNILVTQWELKYYLDRHKGNCPPKAWPSHLTQAGYLPAVVGDF
uniref:Tubulin tyrosine ligase like 4 n=1 Tax=Malurus cyaneus samueli TaxID=2593467 RepID=A0A8C5U291_9PASS